MFFPLKDENPSDGKPMVTISLIVANTAIFIGCLALGDSGYTAIIYQFGMIPAQLTLYTPFTSMFLHGGFGHIIGNLWFLWIFGDNIESACGRKKFILFYILSGLFAGFLHFLLYPGSSIPTIGASGAIAGVLGAYLILYPKAKVLTLIWFFIITTTRIPAVWFLGFWFVMQLFYGGIGVISEVSTGIAYWAHIGGFLAGAGLILILRNNKPKNAII